VEPAGTVHHRAFAESAIISKLYIGERTLLGSGLVFVKQKTDIWQTFLVAVDGLYCIFNSRGNIDWTVAGEGEEGATGRGSQMEMCVPHPVLQKRRGTHIPGGSNRNKSEKRLEQRGDQ